MDIRKEISSRIGRAALVKLVAGKVPQRSIYNFMGDEPNDIGSTALGHIFDALNIVLVDKAEWERLRDQKQRSQEVVDGQNEHLELVGKIAYLKSLLKRERRLPGDPPFIPARLKATIAALEKELGSRHAKP